jgi:CDP-diglyceride synthetase
MALNERRVFMSNNILPERNKKWSALGLAVGWIFALAVGFLGIMLLVVEKITAGTAFVLAALIALPPFNSFIKNVRLPKWLPITAILFFCVIAVVSISGTDIPPANRITGIRFVDQVWTLLQEFMARIL